MRARADSMAMARPRAVIFDIDGTIASAIHRVPYIEEAKPPDWSGFHGAMVLDSPIAHTVRKLRAHRKAGDRIILLSMRPERFRRFTERWLRDMNITYSKLYLRPENDYRPATSIKLDILQKQIAPRYDVVGAYDDRPDVLDVWKSAGIPGHKVTDPGLPPFEGLPVPDPKFPRGRIESGPRTAGKGGVGSVGLEVYVPGYERIIAGHVQHVDGYYRKLSAVERLADKLTRLTGRDG